jgi:hypothetical protein
MTYQITLDAEEVTKLVAHDLRVSYDSLNEEFSDEYSSKCKDAIRTVLQYYMSPTDYNRWLDSLDEDEYTEQ